MSSTVVVSERSKPGDDSLLHVRGRQSVVIPHDAYNGNINFRKMSVGVREITSGLINRMTSAKTMNVYGRLSARRTIHILCFERRRRSISIYSRSGRPPDLGFRGILFNWMRIGSADSILQHFRVQLCNGPGNQRPVCKQTHTLLTRFLLSHDLADRDSGNAFHPHQARPFRHPVLLWSSCTTINDKLLQFPEEYLDMRIFAGPLDLVSGWRLCSDYKLFRWTHCFISWRPLPRFAPRLAGPAGARRALFQAPMAIDWSISRRAGHLRHRNSRRSRQSYYIGTPGGGIWKTTDGGQVWRPFSMTRASRRSARSPSRPRMQASFMWALASRRPATACGNQRTPAQHGRQIGLEKTRFISTVLVDPRNPDVVLVAALGDRFSGEKRGVFKTTDGGRTWNKTFYRDEQSGVIDLRSTTPLRELFMPRSGAAEATAAEASAQAVEWRRRAAKARARI